MANDRTQDLVLKANIDQAVGPLTQVTQRVKDLMAAITQQGEAAKTGDTSLKEFAKTLRDLTQASNDLLRARVALEDFQRKADTDASKQAIVDTRRQARDAYATSIPAESERTTAQQKKLDTFNRSLTSAIERANTATAAYARMTQELERMGVVSDKFVGPITEQQRRVSDAHAQITEQVRLANQVLPTARAQSDALPTILRNAAAEKVAADERAKANAKELADQTKLEEVRRNSILGVVQRQQAFRATDDAQAARVRSTGSATQTAVDEGAQRNARRFDTEEAFRQDDLAKQRRKDSAAYQADRAAEMRAAQAYWEEEDEGAARARKSAEAFQAEVAKAASRADAGAARVAGQTGALVTPNPLAAPTLAEQVRGALATRPGPGAGPTDLAGLQAQVAQVSATLTQGSQAVTNYSATLRSLDAVARETLRQSQIIDSFNAQRTATEGAISAYKDAEAELLRLREILNGVTDKEQLSEVTSEIAKLQRQIGTEGGNGLAAAVRSNVDALEVERAKLASIGVATDDVTEATNKLTAVATQAANARTEALARERAEIARVAGETEARAAAASGRIASGNFITPAPSAQQTVADKFAKPEDLDDATTAAEKLQGTLTTGAVTAGTFQHNMEKVYAVQQLIAKDASLIDSWHAQNEAVAQANENFKLAEAELQRVVAAAKNGEAGFNELANAERRFNAATVNLDTQNAKQMQLATQLKARKIDIDNETAATERLAAAAARVAQVQGGIKSTGFLGLQPYQLKNLEYQIGDIYTQLSLGQGLFRTFNAQADQVFQLWDISISRMKLIALYGLPAAAALGAVYEVMSRANQTTEAQRGWAAQLAASSDGAAYQTMALVKLQRQIEDMGVSWTDAGLAIQKFRQDGFSTDDIARFAQAARDLVKVYKVDFVEALKQVATTVSGTQEEIEKLNNEGPVRFLSSEQQEAMRALFDARNPAGARAIAFDAAAAAYARGAKEALSGLQQGTVEVTNSWHHFLDAIGGTSAIRKTNTEVQELAHGFANLLEILSKPIDTPFLKDMPRQMGEILVEEGKILSGLRLWKTLLSALPGGQSEVTSGAGEVKENREGGGRGAVGLFQLRQGAARSVGLNVPTTGEPFTPEGRAGDDRYDYAKNIQGGVDYFKQLLDQLKSVEDATRAYFAGPDAASRSPNAGLSYAIGVSHESTSGIDPKVLADITGAFDKTFKGYEGDRDAALQRILQIAVHETGARQFNAGAPGAPGSAAPVTGPQPLQPGSDANATTNKQVLDKILDDIKGERNRRLQDEDARLRAQANREAVEKTKTEEAYKTVKSGDLSPEVKKAISDFGQLQYDKEMGPIIKREADATQALTDRLAALREAADKVDKTDPARQREAVNIAFDRQLADVQKTFRQGGATAIAGAGGEQAITDSINKDRAAALEKATVDADTAIVEAITKTRDEKIKDVTEKFRTGGVTADEAFTRFAAIIAEYGPKVRAAVAKAQADLRLQPQTAGVQAASAKLDVEAAGGAGAARGLDEISLQRINDLIAARNDNVKKYNDLVSQGKSTQAIADADSLAAYAKAKKELDPLIADLQKQLDTQKQLGQITPEEYSKWTAQLQQATIASSDLTKTQKELLTTLQNDVIGDAVKGFDTIAQALGNVVARTGNWTQVLQAVGRAFVTFAADFLRQIAEMIIKQTLLNSLQAGAASGTGAGGFIQTLAGWIGGSGAAAGGAGAAAGGAGAVGADAVGAAAVLAHTGGVVGALSMSRSGINPSLWATAPRLHAGGLVGLAPNEVPAILQNGEEVLTASDARHRNNVNPEVTSGAPQSIRNVLVMNPADLSAAMAGSHGEKVVLTHIKNNPGAVRSILNGR